jgi:hypothetical protein
MLNPEAVIGARLSECVLGEKNSVKRMQVPAARVEASIYVINEEALIPIAFVLSITSLSDILKLYFNLRYL